MKNAFPAVVSLIFAAPSFAAGAAAPARKVPTVLISRPAQLATIHSAIPELPPAAASFSQVASQLLAGGGQVLALRAPDAVALVALGHPSVGWVPTDAAKPASVAQMAAEAQAALEQKLAEGVASGDYSAALESVRGFFDGQKGVDASVAVDSRPSREGRAVWFVLRTVGGQTIVLDGPQAGGREPADLRLFMGTPGAMKAYTVTGVVTRRGGPSFIQTEAGTIGYSMRAAPTWNGKAVTDLGGEAEFILAELGLYRESPAVAAQPNIPSAAEGRPSRQGRRPLFLFKTPGGQYVVVETSVVPAEYYKEMRVYFGQPGALKLAKILSEEGRGNSYDINTEAGRLFIDKQGGAASWRGVGLVDLSGETEALLPQVGLYRD